MKIFFEKTFCIKIFVTEVKNFFVRVKIFLSIKIFSGVEKILPTENFHVRPNPEVDHLQNFFRPSPPSKSKIFGNRPNDHRSGVARMFPFPTGKGSGGHPWYPSWVQNFFDRGQGMPRLVVMTAVDKKFGDSAWSQKPSWGEIARAISRRWPRWLRHRGDPPLDDEQDPATTYTSWQSR